MIFTLAKDGRSRAIAFGQFLLFALLLFASLQLLPLIVNRLHLPGIELQALAGNAFVAAAAILATYVLSRFDEYPFAAFGLSNANGKMRLWLIGLAAGFALLTSLLVLLRLVSDFRFGTITSSGADGLRFGLLYAALFLAVAFAEETLTRGYALVKLSQSISFWPAALVLAALFAAGHLKHIGEDLLGIFFAGAFGVLLAWSFKRTGSLWFALGVHASWDYAESFIYGVPDSGVVLPGTLLSPHMGGPVWLTGGSAGPEGSVLMVLIMLAFAAIIARLPPENEPQPSKDRDSS